LRIDAEENFAPRAGRDRVERESRVLATAGRSLKYLLLLVLCFLSAFPFYYNFVLASWPNKFAYVNPPKIWFGPSIADNWNQLIGWVPTFPRNFANSAGLAIAQTAAAIFFCTVVGFAFAKYRFKGRKALYAVVLATLSVPAFLNIIPIYRMMSALGWYRTYLPLVIPGMAGAFGVFLMTQFIQGAVPSELLDAARIDGLSEYGIVMRIGFPLARSGIAVLGIVTFIGSWKEFLAPLVFLPDQEAQTLPVILAQLSLRGNVNFSAMMMGTALSLLPLIVIFAFFSRQIISGLTAGSLKG